MRSIFVRLAGAVAVLFLFVAHVQAQSTLQMQSGAHGPTSIQFGGSEVLAGGQIQVLQQGHFPGPLMGEKDGPREPEVRFDAAKNQLTEIYSWGVVSCVYRVANDRIYLDVAIKNLQSTPMRYAELSLMRLRLPGW